MRLINLKFPTRVGSILELLTSKPARHGQREIWIFEKLFSTPFLFILKFFFLFSRERAIKRQEISHTKKAGTRQTLKAWLFTLLLFLHENFSVDRKKNSVTHLSIIVVGGARNNNQTQSRWSRLERWRPKWHSSSGRRFCIIIDK